MFEVGLYKYVSSNFTVSNADISFSYAVAPETISGNYIVMYVLDANGDPQVLCDEQFDSADSFIQFNVYSNNPKVSFYIKRQLDIFLTQIDTLTEDGVSYKIGRTVHNSSPSAQTLNNGLVVDVLAKTFIYEKGN